MISLILMKKIFSLFLIMLMGALLVKCRILKAEDSRSLSLVTLYLIVPCVILSAFQVEYTPEVRDGLLLALAAAVAIHILLILLSWPLGRLLHLDPLEKATAIYSNSGNLVIPLVTALVGSEWVIYASAFMSVQLFLLWSHGKALLCGETSIDLKKILSNINMISILAGIVLFATGLHFPGPVEDAIDSLSVMVGPISMLVTGMLIGGMDLKKTFAYKRLWLVTALRLVIFPLVVLVLLKYSGMASLVENGETILLITLLAAVTPSASSVTQMAQVYNRDADYASAINVATTLLCIVTMPALVFLYQL